MSLKNIPLLYANYFLEVKYTEAGTYFVHDEWATFTKPWVNIGRPGEDWNIILESEGTGYLVRLCECWAGTEMKQFHLEDINDLTPMFSGFQQEIERLSEAR
jgi:hypothetical protein